MRTLVRLADRKIPENLWSKSRRVRPLHVEAHMSRNRLSARRLAAVSLACMAGVSLAADASPRPKASRRRRASRARRRRCCTTDLPVSISHHMRSTRVLAGHGDDLTWGRNGPQRSALRAGRCAPRRPQRRQGCVHVGGLPSPLRTSGRRSVSALSVAGATSSIACTEVIPRSTAQTSKRWISCPARAGRPCSSRDTAATPPRALLRRTTSASPTDGTASCLPAVPRSSRGRCAPRQGASPGWMGAR